MLPITYVTHCSFLNNFWNSKLGETIWFIFCHFKTAAKQEFIGALKSFQKFCKNWWGFLICWRSSCKILVAFWTSWISVNFAQCCCPKLPILNSFEIWIILWIQKSCYELLELPWQVWKLNIFFLVQKLEVCFMI